MNPKSLKWAIVKQDCYNDLYVGNKSMTPKELIFRSRSRIGPSALLTMLNADFYTVKEEGDPECQLWKQKAISRPVQQYRENGQKAHGKYVTRCSDINWSQYDIVISMEISVPTRITRNCKKTLWCYMISEPYMAAFRGPIIPGYDVRLNQELGNGIVTKLPGGCYFPYPFIQPRSLFRLVEDELKGHTKKGVFQEVNSAYAGFDFTKFRKFGPIYRTILKNESNDRVKETLINLCKAKYFMKLGGRYIRGNQIVEAIACKTLALGRADLIHYGKLLPSDLKVKNMRHAIQKIEHLEKDAKLYNRLLAQQEQQMKQFVIQRPLASLMSLYERKIG